MKSVNKGAIMNKDIEKQRIESRKKIYNFLIKYITENGYVPSIREICTGTDISSTTSIYRQLLTLEDEGKIKMKANSSRAIKLVGYEFVKVEELT